MNNKERQLFNRIFWGTTIAGCVIGCAIGIFNFFNNNPPYRQRVCISGYSSSTLDGSDSECTQYGYRYEGTTLGGKILPASALLGFIGMWAGLFAGMVVYKVNEKHK